MRRDLVTAAAVGALLAAIGALAVYAVRQQQSANREILARLDEVRVALGDQSARSGELANQVTALTERVGRLEADNRDLRSQVAALVRRKPVEVARALEPTPLEARSLAPIAEHSMAIAPSTLVATIPITWAAAYSSYQPAGIIAPPPQVVVTRRLTDPAFMKTMYYTYGALQLADGITTVTAVNRGARELNPLLGPVAGNPAAVFGVKAATVAGTILTVEMLRKKHPVVATVSLIALNATLAVVAVNNASVITRQEPR